jgi:hypothetical protein
VNVVAALLYACSSSVLIALLLAFARGGLSSGIALAAVCGGVAVGAWSLWQQRSESPSPQLRPSAWEWAVIFLFALFSARAFFWLVFTDGDAIKVLSPNNLGDLSLHLTYLRNLASGVRFWPENPIFTGGALTYPIGVDFFNSLLVSLGVDPLRGLIWVGVIGATLTGFALWHWGRSVALLALLANGGLAGFAVFVTWQFADFQADLAWKNLFLSIFITQRGLLFALPAGLLLLSSWRARFFNAAEDRWRLPLWGEVLLYASLPLFHLHSFIFFSLLLAGWFVLHAPARRELLGLVGYSLAPATALVLLVTDRLRGASVIGWKPGWMWDDALWLKWCEEHLPGVPTVNSALLFWPMNFGFVIPLIVLLGWRLWKNPRATWPRALYFPALFIFLLCCFVKFAPWEWDNTKIMLWSYLALVPLAWNELLAARPLWQRGVAAFLLFGSGFASLIGGLDGKHTGHEIARRSVLDGVEKAVAALPVGERFAAYPTFNHPLLLVGRKVALGYPGHTWSHGLPADRITPTLEALMNGDDGWQTHAQKLGLRYLFWGAEEREHYPDSTEPWKVEMLPIARGDWGEIYDLRHPPKPVVTITEPAATTEPPRSRPRVTPITPFRSASQPR